MIESGGHDTRWRVAKYHEDIGPFRGRESEFYARFEPFEVVEGEGNILTAAGVALMLSLLIGDTGDPYDSANAHVGVGNDGSAELASQTDLLGGSTFRGAMDSGFPVLDGTTMLWQAAFGPSEANFAWHEWGIFNDAAAGTMLNRRAESFGTKSTGTWVLQVGVRIF